MRRVQELRSPSVTGRRGLHWNGFRIRSFLPTPPPPITSTAPSLNRMSHLNAAFRWRGVGVCPRESGRGCRPCVSLVGCGGFDKPEYIPSPSTPPQRRNGSGDIKPFICCRLSRQLSRGFPLQRVSPGKYKAQIYISIKQQHLAECFLAPLRIQSRPPEFPLIFKRQPNSASSSSSFFFLSNKLFLPLFFSISWGARSSWEWVCGCWWTPRDFGKSWQPTPCCSLASTSSWAWEACSFSWASSAAAEPSVKTSVCCSL